MRYGPCRGMGQCIAYAAHLRRVGLLGAVAAFEQSHVCQRAIGGSRELLLGESRRESLLAERADLCRNVSAHMGNNDPGSQTAGRINAGKSPDLALLVGVEDPPWQPSIQPDADVYPLARLALDHQDQWGDPTHADFWANLLAAWPRRRGNRALRSQLAAAVARWGDLGHTDTEIADALGYSQDSLRRMGVLSEADTHHRAASVDAVSRASATMAAALTLKSASLADLKSREGGKLLAAANRAMARHAPPRLPRIVLTDDERYVVGHDHISREALSDADRRARKETQDLISRAEQALRARRHHAARQLPHSALT